MLEIQNDFPLLRKMKEDGRRFVYFDNAATSQKPDCVIDALAEWYVTRNANPHRGTYRLSQAATDTYEAARQTVAFHIGARKEEVVFCRNTTEAINLAAQNFAAPLLEQGDEIALPISEHHSNLLPWQRLAKEKKVRLRFLLTDRQGRIPQRELEEKIGSHTKIVACAQVSNVLGTVFPLEKVIGRAKKVGAYTVIDCAQGLLHCGIDVGKLGADFAAFSSHKALGPNGIGVLWGRKELLERMTPFLRGGEMVKTVSERSALFEPAPLKFEAGTQDPAGVYGFAVALDYLEHIGREKIHEHEASLTRQLLDGIAKIPGIRIYGNPEYAEDRLGIVTFNIAGQDASAIAFYLDRNGITVRAGTHCAQPLLSYLGTEAACRVSLAPYNTGQEVAYFLECLRSIPDLIAANTLKGR